MVLRAVTKYQERNSKYPALILLNVRDFIDFAAEQYGTKTFLHPVIIEKSSSLEQGNIYLLD
jgi:hypothetical protein